MPDVAVSRPTATDAEDLIRQADQHSFGRRPSGFYEIFRVAQRRYQQRGGSVVDDVEAARQAVRDRVAAARQAAVSEAGQLLGIDAADDEANKETNQQLGGRTQGGWFDP